jgi:hypothetical protein
VGTEDLDGLSSSLSNLKVKSLPDSSADLTFYPIRVGMASASFVDVEALDARIVADPRTW